MSDASDEYVGGVVHANRHSENRILFTVDADGYVVGAPMLDPGASDPMQFLRVLRDHSYPLDPADVVTPPLWPFDADGRGLSLLEVTRGHHLTIPLRKSA